MSAKRVDANHAQLVRLLRQLGCSVWDTHELGHGGVDIVVGRNSVNVLCEIKSERGKLTEDEAEFHAGWKGRIAIIRSEEDALALAQSLAGGES